MNEPPAASDHGSPATDVAPEAMARFPWPPPEDTPVTTGFADTWREAVFHPVRFFRALPRAGSTGPALLYYLIIGILAAAIQLFWAALLPDPGAGPLDELLGAGAPASPLVDFLLSPLLLLLSLFLTAGVTHLMVLALVPGNGGFATTLRIFAFAYSPSLFNVVPYLGAIAAFFWMTALSIIGIREAHRTSTGRAVTAVLIPLLLAGLFLAVGYLLMRSGALLVS